MTARILVTGGDGLLGRELRIALAAAGHDVVAVDAADFDVTDAEATTRAIVEEEPDAIVHAAAWTAVDDCESDPDRAMAVNGLGALHVASAARRVGARLMLLSTDYVFDGEKAGPYDESDPVGPLSVYGRSKLFGERLASGACPGMTIVRTQSLFGRGGPNFVESILGAVAAGRPLRVVADQRSCPTYAPHLATQIVRILDGSGEGLYHVSARGECSWYGLARAILDESGRADVPVEPIGSAALDRPAPRPRNAVLRNMHLELTIGDGMPPWQDGLRAYLAERKDA